MEKVSEVQLSKIKITENHRVNVEKTNLDELMQSIKQHGLMQPIGLAPNGKGKYKLRFGQRRFLACQKLGYKTITAMISGEIKEEKLLLENLTENMQRSDPSFAEFGRIIKKLEDEYELSLKEISVRLGVPTVKVTAIRRVYNDMPEKYRKRVAFLSPGSGRSSLKNKMIPAQVATKIVAIKKQHGLNDASVGHIFDTVSSENLDAADLTNVGDLIAGGMSAERALKHITDYGVFSINVVGKHTEIAELMEKYGVISKKHLFKKIMYGELPPLVKPSWISTGIIIEKPKVEKIDNKQFAKMRGELVKLAKAGHLRETQMAALLPTKELPLDQWTEEQCHQVESILEDVKRDMKG